MTIEDIRAATIEAERWNQRFDAKFFAAKLFTVIFAVALVAYLLDVRWLAGLSRWWPPLLISLGVFAVWDSLSLVWTARRMPLAETGPLSFVLGVVFALALRVIQTILWVVLFGGLAAALLGLSKLVI